MHPVGRIILAVCIPVVCAGCASGAESGAAKGIGTPRFEFVAAGSYFATAFETEVARCSGESPTLNTMLGPLRRSARPLRVAPDISVLFALPYDRDYSPLLRIDLADFDIFPDGAEIERMLEDADGPGSIFPYTPHCAALAHSIFEAIVYRRDYARGPARTAAAAERARAAANLETVLIENDIAFDYGHRVEAEDLRMDRVGQCHPEAGEIHVIIERHSEIIHYKGAKAEGIEVRFNTGRGACVNAVTGRPIESWIDENSDM